MGINEQPRTERLANLMGRRPVSWLQIDRGYIPAERWVVRSETVLAFAKIGRRSTHRNGCVSNIVCTRRPLRRDSQNSWDGTTMATLRYWRWKT